MKIILCILITGLATLHSSAQEIDSLVFENVFAPSGITLRAIPSSTGQALSVIPFGDKIQVLDNTGKIQIIEWLEGEWVRIQHQGREGYIFNGFTSKLPLPYLDFELTQNDLDLSYPLLAWAESNFDPVKRSDTLDTGRLYREIHYLDGEISLMREETPYHFKVELTIPGIRMAEAFNLMRSMLLSQNEIEIFNRKARFIKNEVGQISRISVDIDNPVDIRVIDGENIRISVVAFHKGCSL